MRILALTEASDRSETALLIGLKSAGLEIDVIGALDPHHSSRLSEEHIAQIPLACRSKLDLKAIRTIRGILKSKTYDLMHAFTSRMLSNALLASFGLDTKIVAYRGTTGHVSRFDPTSWITYLHRRVSAISCVSHAVRNYLLSVGVPESKLFTIYKGHDSRWYSEKQPKDLGEFNVPSSAVVISCVANMRPVKGVDILLESVLELISKSPQDPPLHVLLIGEVRDVTLQELDPSIAPFVHFLGYRTDASQIVGASTIYVQPSRAREGLPKAVIEAMSQGLPVVVSDAGGLPELVRHEVDGLVFKAGDSHSLSICLERLLGDSSLRTRLGLQAKQRISADFSVEKTVQATLQMYAAIL